MKYQAVFFDLDGTLLDTSKGIILATDYILEKFGLAPLTLKEKKIFIGPPIQDSFQQRYNLPMKQAWELATAWRDVYKDRFLLEAVPYEGIYDILRLCRKHGIKIGVATNKREDYTKKLLEHFGFTPFFDWIAGTDFEGKLKKADLIRLCMEKTSVSDGEKCLMVGDTEGDQKAALQAGVQFLGVTYGFGFSNDVAQTGTGYPILVNDCQQLASWLIP